MAVVLIVGMLSHRRGAIVAILLGLTAMLASVSLGSEWPPIPLTSSVGPPLGRPAALSSSTGG